MIAIVNIKDTIVSTPVKQATENAWNFNLENASKCKFLVGVSNGKPVVFLKVFDVVQSSETRVSFSTEFCDFNEILIILGNLYGENTDYITKKYVALKP